MKKSQRIALQYKKIKQAYPQLQSLVQSTKPKKLWQQEAVIRKNLQRLKKIPSNQFSDYSVVYNQYLILFQQVSEHLLNHYNRKNHTDYKLNTLLEQYQDAYLHSGILSVLISQHIPHLVAQEFNRVFPENPKDEYPQARRIKRKFILHLGDTNTGKTHHAIQQLMACSHGIYLAPLRILALENYERLNQNGILCSLETGEEELLTEGATHTCCTIEKLHTNIPYQIAVIDEIQLIANSQRGAAWTRAILGLRAEEIHVCGAINVKNQLIRMITDCGDTYEFYEYHREIPLKVLPTPISLSKIHPGDALIAFSKRNVLSLAQYFSNHQKPCSIIYGDLPPEVRKLQYHTFLSGERPILISTDAIGMGVNLPIRRIIFTQLCKFDGEEVRTLTSQEVKQIAGRAGRRGIYDVGFVGTTTNNIPLLDYLLHTPDEEIAQATLGPSEAILEIKQLPLLDKLALWSTRSNEISTYSKMDVRDFLRILEKIKCYKLSESVQWKLMHLPFDVNNDILLTLFLEYIEWYFIKGKSELFKPFYVEDNLASLECYYQEISLYSSFSRAFHLPYDQVWTNNARARVSAQIHHYLCNS